MKLFTIDNKGKFTPYKKHDFKKSNKESTLEVLLEKNPEYFFEKSKVLIIGRQVTTNLNTFIDLLGIDKYGNTVAIELKRDKTPRETLAQLLEYASFVENLDYSDLNSIYQEFTGEESSLEDGHQEYFREEIEENVSFNKSTKLVIVAQKISKEIKQTALFLSKKGLDIYCMEFNYFETKAGEKIISSDFIVGEEEFIRHKPKSASLPKINEEQFLNSLDKNGSAVFRQIFEFGKQKGFGIRWGSKGFSMSYESGDSFVSLFLGFSPDAVFKQSIYTKLRMISKRVNDYEEVINFYKSNLKKLIFFVKAESNLKWEIDKPYTKEEVKSFLNVVDKVAQKIKEKGLSIKNAS